jgi:hypothetical protein
VQQTWGRTVIGNYTWDTEDVGYMEAFMGWRLLYRDAKTMMQLVSDRRLADASIVPDTTGAVIYLDVGVR